MHNMLMKMPNTGKFLHLFPSLLGSRNKMASVNCGLIPDKLSEPARHTEQSYYLLSTPKRWQYPSHL